MSKIFSSKRSLNCQKKKKIDFQILLLESWVAWAWWVTSLRVRKMTVFLVLRIFGASGWLHYTLRKTQFQPMLNSVYNTLVWGHWKMSLPCKCQMLGPPPPYITASYFFHYTLSPHVTRQIVTNIFHDEKP